MATPTGPHYPGWYPDPGSPSDLRYWDGEAWTDQRHPAPPAGAADPTRGTTPPPPGPSAGPGPPTVPVIGKPAGNWFARHKGLTIGGGIAALVLICVCASIINAVGGDDSEERARPRRRRHHPLARHPG